MLLDLWPLFQTGVQPVRRGGGYVRTRPAPKPKPAHDYQDLGILVDAGQAIMGVWGGPTARARLLLVAAEDADLVAVEAFRAVSRWQDQGDLVGDEGNLDGILVFLSGNPAMVADEMSIDGGAAFLSAAPAIAAADDELILGGDF